MPYSPRPSISFPAFQTPAGLLPQADREHRSDYSETQGQARELNRRTDGYWIYPPFAPSRFLAVAPAVLQVMPQNVITFRYKLIGATLHLHFHIFGNLTADSPYLGIVYPERLIAREFALMPCHVANTAYGVLVCQTHYHENFLRVYNLGFAPWTAGGIRMGSQIEIEVEER